MAEEDRRTTVRVALVTPALTQGMREGRFGGDGPLGAREFAACRTAANGLPRADRVFTAPGPRCRGTAAALGLTTAREAGALADWDPGRWRGHRLADLAESEPEGVAAWLADPAAAPHGGESLHDLVTRAAAWLDGLPGGRTLAVAEPAVVRAALVHALNLPPAAFWRLDAGPLSLTLLTGRSGRWNLRCGSPLTETDGAP
jgi:broad specificity phosphatase PhoE